MTRSGPPPSVEFSTFFFLKGSLIRYTKYNSTPGRSKFGERFYRVIIMDFKKHTKAILVEAAVLLGKFLPQDSKYDEYFIDLKFTFLST